MVRWRRPTRQSTFQGRGSGRRERNSACRNVSVHHFRYRHNSGDVWVAEQAAPFGLVKALTKDHITITLARLAAHAKDKITATPQPFNAKELERQHLLDMNRDYPLLQDLWGLMNPGPRTLKKFWKEP